MNFEETTSQSGPYSGKHAIIFQRFHYSTRSAALTDTEQPRLAWLMENAGVVEKTKRWHFGTRHRSIHAKK